MSFHVHVEIKTYLNNRLNCPPSLIGNNEKGAVKAVMEKAEIKANSSMFIRLFFYETIIKLLYSYYMFIILLYYYSISTLLF